jgi:hypothetical protein
MLLESLKLVTSNLKAYHRTAPAATDRQVKDIITIKATGMFIFLI